MNLASEIPSLNVADLTVMLHVMPEQMEAVKNVSFINGLMAGSCFAFGAVLLCLLVLTFKRVQS
jgi:hypothetical protein